MGGLQSDLSGDSNPVVAGMKFVDEMDGTVVTNLGCITAYQAHDGTTTSPRLDPPDLNLPRSLGGLGLLHDYLMFTSSG